MWMKPLCNCTWAFLSKNDAQFLPLVFSPIWGENFLMGLGRKHLGPTIYFLSSPPNQIHSKKFFFPFSLQILPSTLFHLQKNTSFGTKLIFSSMEKSTLKSSIPIIYIYRKRERERTAILFNKWREQQNTWEYKKVPRIAMAAPRALMGWTGVLNIMIDETMTDIRFMVLPMLNVKGEIWSRDMYDTWL